jgi:hypothetical protein
VIRGAVPARIQHAINHVCGQPRAAAVSSIGRRYRSKPCAQIPCPVVACRSSAERVSPRHRSTGHSRPRPCATRHGVRFESGQSHQLMQGPHVTGHPRVSGSVLLISKYRSGRDEQAPVVGHAALGPVVMLTTGQGSRFECRSPDVALLLSPGPAGGQRRRLRDGWRPRACRGCWTRGRWRFSG